VFDIGRHTVASLAAVEPGWQPGGDATLMVPKFVAGLDFLP